MIAGIRPLHFHIADDGMTDRVTVVAPTGCEMYVQAMLGGTPITADFRERYNLGPGDELRFGVVPGATHLCDKESGLRLNA